MIHRIEKPIKLLSKVDVDKDEFINDELKPSAKTVFRCSNCSTENEINIVPYKTGFPFSKIYKNDFLSRKDILSHNIALPSSPWVSHLGKYLVSNLPTLYFVEHCTSCSKSFLVVFGFGESQPSKWVCKISGVWTIEVKS